MRRVDLITDIPFWSLIRGDASRIRALAEFLGPRTALRVVLLAKTGQLHAPVTRGRIKFDPSMFDVVSVVIDPNSQARAMASLQAVFRESPPSVALIEYVQLSWLLDVLPAGTRPFLDTHQIAHERNQRFTAAGLPPPNTIDEASEYAAFARYERVILIQQEDLDTVAQRIGMERVLLAPHPVRSLTTKVRAEARSIGFVGSEYLPNLDGLRWFLDAVWPRIGDTAELHIYGGAARCIDAQALPSNVHLDGRVADIDAAYRTFDIAINPVRVGAGLKIKTVEALGAGLPLVTTSEGARGLRDGAGEAFLIADDAEGFAAHLLRLLASRTLREELARGALHLVTQRLNPEACFGPLLRAIERPTPD
jgi:glycosyltransferase involved in cell wall biosynthesis